MKSVFYMIGIRLLLGASMADAAEILTDGKGLTVYTYDNDQGNVSYCYGGCEKAWPPVLDLGLQDQQTGLTTRNDGKVQITYAGKPLYYYVGDQSAGDMNGDGLGGVWHVISK